MKQFRRITDPSKRGQLSYADNAASLRQANAGIDLKPIGALGSLTRVGQGCPVLVFNAGAAIAYVAFGDNTLTAPAGPAAGVPIAPGEKYMLNSGLLSYVIASSATVYGYTGDFDEDIQE